MFSQDFVQGIVDGIVVFATDLLLPLMIFGFVAGILLRAMIYFMIRREHVFASEFEKRVDRFLEDEESHESKKSFYVLVKRILEKNFYEMFEVRAIMKRRKPDMVSSLADRLFLVQHGCARLVKDTLKQIRHLKHDGSNPKLLEVSKNVFENNPCFSRVFGIIPGAVFNDLLNLLPGIFIIGGIFGTFLGIMKALPELGGMDISDVEGTKLVIDNFLLKVSFAMTTSIVGIMLSVAMTIFNTLLSPEKLFINIVNRYESCLDILWNRSTDNAKPSDIADFDEHKDPLEALAEQAINKEIASRAKKGVPRAS